MCPYVLVAFLLLLTVNSSQQLDLLQLETLNEITDTISTILPENNDETNNSTVDFNWNNSDVTSESEKEQGNLTEKEVPFEVRYYTDYFKGEDKHKLFREIVLKSTNERLHCSYAGDRNIVAGLIGIFNEQITEALRAFLPPNFIVAKNVTTEELDNLIDGCINGENNVAPSVKPISMRFLDRLKSKARQFISHLYIFPGTKWCGQGNVARNFDDLGTYVETDKCCREHDFSNKSLAPGESRNGIRNSWFYTMTECSYDDKLRKCLTDAETPHAAALGTLFFNILKTRCFACRKKAYCVQKLPFHPCRKYVYDENSTSRLQIFDPKKFVPKASVPLRAIKRILYRIPGIRTIMKLF